MVFLVCQGSILAGTEVIQSTVAATVAATGSGNETLDFINGRRNCVKCVGYWNKKYSQPDSCDCQWFIFATIGIGLITLLVKYRKVLKGKTDDLYQEIRLLDSKLVLAELFYPLLYWPCSCYLPSVSILLGSGPFILPTFNLYSSYFHYWGL